MMSRWHRNGKALKLALFNLGAPLPAGCQQSSARTPDGISYDLYEPEGNASSTHILLYGMDHAGEKDRRLVRYASSYAATGIRAVVPVLPGLKSFLVDETDLDRICSLTTFLHAWLGTPIRITGFSIGAGYALVAAARAELSPLVDLLLLYSAPYSLADLWQCVLDLEAPDEADKLAWDSFVMAKTAVAYHQLDSLDLTKQDRADFLELMQQHCDRQDEISTFYKDVLAQRDIGDFSLLMPSETTMDRLSPAGKLQDIKARVLLLHDTNDPTSPPDNPSRIMAELPVHSNARGHRMLITPLFSHVTPRVTYRIGDAFTLLDIFSDLFT